MAHYNDTRRGDNEEDDEAIQEEASFLEHSSKGGDLSSNGHIADLERGTLHSQSQLNVNTSLTNLAGSALAAMAGSTIMRSAKPSQRATYR